MLLNKSSSLSFTELQSLRLDGILDSSFDIVGSLQTWQSRSKLVCPDLPYRVVLTSLSAAWALNMGDEPPTHTVAFVDQHRRKNCTLGSTKFEERYLTPNDYWLEDTQGVTTPLRTILDLLRDTKIDHRQIELALALLKANYGYDKEDIVQSFMEKYKMPYKKQALLRLEKCYPSETR